MVYHGLGKIRRMIPLWGARITSCTSMLKRRHLREISSRLSARDANGEILTVSHAKKFVMLHEAVRKQADEREAKGTERYLVVSAQVPESRASRRYSQDQY